MAEDRRTPFRYAQFCSVARAAEILGHRWTLLVLRELFLGPARFRDLRERLGSVSSSVLAERLRDLETRGVIAQRELPPPAGVAVYELTPLRLSPHDWWTWVVLFLADDFVYYWYHRAHHEVRLLWASHVVHHSSQRYNLSTALRQTWTPFTVIPFYVPLAAIGIPPWMIFLEQSVSLIYQFWIHTERIGKLPRWFEFVWNTPSHHRVHHGSNPAYLDRNYGGILIIRDRLFGSFEPEGERVRYGLTKNLSTYNPLRVAFHEYAAIWADMVAATRLRDRLAHLTRGPGWRPASAVELAAP